MLALFQEELRNHLAILRDTLAQLVKNPQDTSYIDVVIQRTHAIWGNAKIVNCLMIAEFAQSIRDYGRILLQKTIPAEVTLWHSLMEVTESLAQWVNQLPIELETLPEPPQELQEYSLVLKQILETLQTQTNNTNSQINHASPKIARSLLQHSTGRSIETVSPSKPSVVASSTASVKSVALTQFDETLLALFKQELEVYINTLSENLLQIEQNQYIAKTEALQALMRAAHSIKGSARVVGLHFLVDIAHLMEDYFVAAQKGTLQLHATLIDNLLKTVDVIAQIIHIPTSEFNHLATQIQICLSELQNSEIAKPVEVTVQQIHVAHNPASSQLLVENNAHSTQNEKPVEPAKLVTSSILPVSATTKPAENTAVNSSTHLQETEQQKRVVRISANKIESLMGLAGEVVVSARWLPPFSADLLHVKRNHQQLTRLLEQLQEQLQASNYAALLNIRGNDENFNPLIPENVSALLTQARHKSRECHQVISQKLNELDVFYSTFAAHADKLYDEVVGVRLRPFADGVRGFPRAVRDIAKQLGKQIRFEIEGKATEVDQEILEKLDAPLTHLLRNAIDHGIEFPEQRQAVGKSPVALLRLDARHHSGMLIISVMDDGMGIDFAELRRVIRQRNLATQEVLKNLSERELLNFLFLPNFSTKQQVTEFSGRGVGLNIVHEMIHEIGGTVRIETERHKGTCFYLELPITLSVLRTFLVELQGEVYAFPLARIERCLIVNVNELQTIEDRQFFRFAEHNIAIIKMQDLLELSATLMPNELLNIVIISDRQHFYGLIVDKFIGEYDVVVRPLDPRLGSVPNINSVTVTLGGTPVLIFDVESLLHSIDALLSGRRPDKITSSALNATVLGIDNSEKRVLVVDDSLTVRELERRLLENHGYQVTTAIDGMEAWQLLRNSYGRRIPFELLISDIDMPRMNGIELIKRLRQEAEFSRLPVMVVSYKDSEEHRLQGLEAGANYYLTKRSFEDNAFIEAVIDLIGKA